MRCTLLEVVFVIKLNVIGDFARMSCFCGVAPSALTHWRLFMVVFLLYVNHYCLTVIAVVIVTYFIFFLCVELVMSMCVQEG